MDSIGHVYLTKESEKLDWNKMSGNDNVLSSNTCEENVEFEI